MGDRRQRIVEAGYDQLGKRYLAWSSLIENDPRVRFVSEFSNRLRPGARVLDLGCGPGIPSTRELSRRFDVVGVDISETQLEHARANAPHARFVHADATELAFPERVFDGVASLYAISHIPREKHAALFGRIAGWLKPDGLLVATLGAHDSPDWEGDWLGVPMFFSAYEADRNRELLEAAGFELLVDAVVETLEPEGPVEFLWVLARRSVLDGA